MLVVGVGIDLVDVDRFRNSLERTPSLLQRCFTSGERDYALAANDPSERLAARFAAKEAVMKALGVGLGAFGFHDVEVVRSDGGAPDLALRGPALILAGQRLVTGWQLSLTHTATAAGAVVLATRDPASGATVTEGS